MLHSWHLLGSSLLPITGFTLSEVFRQDRCVSVSLLNPDFSWWKCRITTVFLHMQERFSFSSDNEPINLNKYKTRVC